MVRTALRVLVVGVLLPWSHAAPADTASPLKTEINSYIHRLEASTGGRLHWDDAGSFEVKESGDTATATIANAALSFRKEPGDQKPIVSVTLDRIEIRRAPAATGANLTEYLISFPASSTITGSDGTEVTVSLKDGRMSLVLEAPGDLQRAMTLTVGGGRVEQKDHKDYLAFGPLASSWKIVRTDSGGWHAPLDFELKGLEFLFADAALAGAVDRMLYAGEAVGPSLTELDAMRDKVAEIREQDSPEQKVAGWLDLLPKLVAVFSSSKGDLTIENITVKKPDGETQVTLKKANLGGGLSGLDGEKATFSVSIGYEGLTIAPSLLPEVRVPQRGVIDLALEDIATSALRTLAEAGSEAKPDAPDEVRQKAIQQRTVTAMSLNPVLRLREAAMEFKHVKIAATGEAKRAPPMPVGYSATAQIAVRGFDALSDIVTSNLGRAYLPLLKFIGTAEAAADGTAAVKFHVTSGFGQTIAVNGSNLAAWFDAHASSSLGSAQLSTLQLADPPMTGDDVSAVQQALPADKRGSLIAGSYDTATALAVAQFQKDSGLNVDGVVDAKTRDKLGIKPPPPPPAPQPTPPKN
ncbi:MAG TPA: peptidoglycan-binding domain-containing protein [Stellaceae bacterium]|nr:peptidoglycan-binding domain-containing protein [Stellaceae bacterium]